MLCAKRAHEDRTLPFERKQTSTSTKEGLSTAGSWKQGEREETVLLQTQAPPGSGEVFAELELELNLA
jgi:hypothetical protein